MIEYSENKEYQDLENAVLGAIILEEEALSEVSSDLKPHCFLETANQHIFQAILELREGKVRIDMLTVSQKIASKGLLDAVGGRMYIPSLTNRVASASNLESHARLVIQGYLTRKLTEICSQGLVKVSDRNIDIFEVYEDVKAKFENAISEVTGNRSFDTIESIGDEFLKELNDKKNGLIPPGLEIGLTDLDAYGGFNKSDLIYVGARPGMGKTSFLIKGATHCAFNLKKAVGIFSIEMKSKQLLTRIAAIDCRINSSDLRNGKVEDYQINQLHTRINALKSSKLYIDDRSRDLTTILSQARKMHKKHKIEQLYIDYLGLITVKGYRGDANGLLTHVSAELKNLAKELDIPVIVFFQLNRDIEKRPISNRLPLMSDARGSGSIEQDADQMIVLFRPQVYEDCPNDTGFDGKVTYYLIDADTNERTDVTNKCFVGYVKNRHGAIGTELVGFRNQYTEFHNIYEPILETQPDNSCVPNNNFLKEAF